MINLNNWKIALPIDDKGGKTGNAKQVTDLNGYSFAPWYMPNDDGSVTFRAPTDGARTSPNTKYSRTEAREMDLKANGAQGAESAWTVTDAGADVLQAVLRIDAVPVNLKTGALGHIVIGQAHGQKEELFRLYYEPGDGGSLVAHCDQTGTDKKEREFPLLSGTGKKPQIKIGEQFTYRAIVEAHKLTITAVHAGVNYQCVIPVISVWDKDKFYFKFGVYLGVNASQGFNGVGTVTFFDATVSHGVIKPVEVIPTKITIKAGNGYALEVVQGAVKTVVAPNSTFETTTSGRGDALTISEIVPNV